MYVTGPEVPPVAGLGGIPRSFAVAYEASPMIVGGPVSPKIANSS
jgi:hypothetical protein